MFGFFKRKKTAPTLDMSPGMNLQLTTRFAELLNQMAAANVYLPKEIVAWIETPAAAEHAKNCAYILLEARHHNPYHSDRELFDSTVASLQPRLTAESASRQASAFTLSLAARMADMPDLARSLLAESAGQEP